MKKIKKPSIVLFDLDNTLYDYDSAHNDAIKAVSKKVKNLLNINEKEFIELYEDAKKIVKSRISNTASSHNRLLYFQKLIELKGLGQQVLIALDLNQTYWNKFLISANIFDGVYEVFDELRLNGVKIGLVTDLTADIQFRKIIKFGLGHCFDCIVTSEEAGKDKPNENCFNIALKKLGIDKSREENIWMIGDDLIKDIKGSKVSINAIGFIFQKKKKVINEFSPDYYFSDFYELLNIIKDVFK